MHGPHGPHGHHGPHGPHGHPHHGLLPHGILPHILPHNPIVHHLMRPKHHIVQKVNVNVYEQPQPSNQNNQYNYYYEEPYYDEEPGVEGANENHPMSTDEFSKQTNPFISHTTPMNTDDYFNLQKQIEDEMRQREWDELKKGKEKKK